MALVNALTSDSDQPPGTPTVSASENTGGSATRSGSAPTGQPQGSPGATSATPLVIRVTGSATAVTVTVAGTGEVLQTGVLNTGEARQYDRAPLNVVAADAGSVEVTIYGQLQPRGQVGQRGEWRVPKK
ncbi:hypothetical protein [Spirillospora sp. NPDC047279]|uniref:hypothetical protein n=1 Tax=Spirillospora sp. NPDC047279 TaxID=3155478 RepID=UPI0034057F28